METEIDSEAENWLRCTCWDIIRLQENKNEVYTDLWVKVTIKDLLLLHIKSGKGLRGKIVDCGRGSMLRLDALSIDADADPEMRACWFWCRYEVDVLADSRLSTVCTYRLTWFTPDAEAGSRDTRTQTPILTQTLMPNFRRWWCKADSDASFILMQMMLTSDALRLILMQILKLMRWRWFWRRCWSRLHFWLILDADVDA